MTVIKEKYLISCQDLYNFICNKRLLILDVRKKDLFNEFHISFSSHNFILSSDCTVKDVWKEVEKNEEFKKHTEKENGFIIFVGDSSSTSVLQTVFSAFSSSFFEQRMFFLQPPLNDFREHYPCFCSDCLILSELKIEKSNLLCEIIPNLFLGPSPHTYPENMLMLKLLKITHILNLCTCVYEIPKGVEYYVCRHEDNLTQILPFFAVTSLLERLLYPPSSISPSSFSSSSSSSSSPSQSVSAARVFVHCHSGMARSASLVAAYLIRKFRISFIEALKLVKAQRNCISPNRSFVYQLYLWDRLVNDLGPDPFFASHYPAVDLSVLFSSFSPSTTTTTSSSLSSEEKGNGGRDDVAVTEKESTKEELTVVAAAASAVTTVPPVGVSPTSTTTATATSAVVTEIPIPFLLCKDAPAFLTDDTRLTIPRNEVFRISTNSLGFKEGMATPMQMPMQIQRGVETGSSSRSSNSSKTAKTVYHNIKEFTHMPIISYKELMIHNPTDPKYEWSVSEPKRDASNFNFW